jgi:hypothetical protein
MEQDFIDIDCIDSEEIVNSSLNSTEQYSVKDLANLLETSDRNIYKYANTLLEAWHWLPESEFRANGIYTAKALEEMKRLKSLKNSSEYIQSVARENQKPSIPTTKTSSSLVVPHRQTEILETRLATLQGNLAAQNLSIQDRIALARQQINSDTSRTQQNQSILTDIRKQQAIADGVQEALELFRVKEEALNATLEQLTIEKLGGV